MSEEERLGRRANGLAASSYALVTECDPRIALALLVALEQAGVAAYSTPAPGRSVGYLDVQLPVRPLARVFADAGQIHQARAVVAAELAETETPGHPPPAEPVRPPGSTAGQNAAGRSGSGEADEESDFAALVARFHAEPDAGAHSWPSAENLPGRENAPGAAPRDVPEPPARPPSLSPPVPHRAYTPGSGPLDIEEHFEPPEPDPFRAPRGAARAAWAVLLLGVALLFAPLFPGTGTGPAGQVVGIFCVLGGLGALVWRLRDGDAGGDPGDDGARV